MGKPVPGAGGAAPSPTPTPDMDDLSGMQARRNKSAITAHTDPEEKLNDAMQSPQPSYEEVLRELADTVTDWIEGEDESVARMEAATFRARALLATGAASTREERDQREAEGTHELLAHFRDERARLSRLLAQLLEAVEEHRGYAAEGGLVADIAQLENKTQPPRLLTDDEIRDLEAENDHKLWDLAAQIQRSNESEEG